MEANSIDQTLIRFYGVKSPEEIAEITGISAISVAKRTEEALGRRDYLGEAARIQLLMAKLEGMADAIQQRLPDMSDRNVSAAVNAAAGAMGRVLGQLTKIQAANRVDLDTVNKRHAQEMVSIVERAGDRVFGELAALYPNMEPDEIQQRFRDNILAVAREVDAG